MALLESAEDAFVAKGALGAISSLVKSNAANKAAVREAQGVAVRAFVLHSARSLASCFSISACASCVRHRSAEQKGGAHSQILWSI